MMVPAGVPFFLTADFGEGGAAGSAPQRAAPRCRTELIAAGVKAGPAQRPKDTKARKWDAAETASRH